MVVDKIKEFWHDQIPGWLPIFVAIVGFAFWIGQQQQSISDRLRTLEIQVQSMQDYMRNEHTKGHSLNDYPPIAANAPQLDAGNPRNP